MKYLVRLNKNAYNTLTHQVVASRLWEVEQCGNKDSEKVLWHCADVRIDGIPLCQLYQLPKQGEQPWEAEYFGICTRGQDNAIEIHTGNKDASGN